MSIVSTYDLLATAITNFKVDAGIAEAAATTAIQKANAGLAVQLGNIVEGALKNEGVRVRERAAQASQ